MALNIFALIVMFVVAAVLIWLVVLLGSLPGKIARQREHPQADAITALGWIGIITLGVAWLIAIVWAYSKPLTNSGQLNDLQKRVAELEQRGDTAERGAAQ
jgi:amino acid transporter